MRRSQLKATLAAAIVVSLTLVGLHAELFPLTGRWAGPKRRLPKEMRISA